MKEPIKGLLDRQGAPTKEWAAKGIRAFVIKVKWRDIQSQPFGELDTSSIDSLLGLCKQPGHYLYGSLVKLRVTAGVDTPGWVTYMSGSTYWGNPKASNSSVDNGFVPCFWTSAFYACYAHLQAKLAAKYDQDDTVRGIMVSGSSTLYDEATARQFSDSPDNLHRAIVKGGYTFDKDVASIADFCYLHEDVWQNTPSYAALQPVSYGEGAFGVELRDRVASYVNVGNHSLSSSKIADKNWTEFYVWLAKQKNAYIQTDSANRIGDPKEVMIFAKSLMVDHVELPQGYQKWSTDQFGGWLDSAQTLR